MFIYSFSVIITEQKSPLLMLVINYADIFVSNLFHLLDFSQMLFDSTNNAKVLFAPVLCFVQTVTGAGGRNSL